MYWFEQAAQQDYIPSILALAKCYTDGRVDALYAIGEIYTEGGLGICSVNANYPKAMLYYGKGIISLWNLKKNV